METILYITDFIAVPTNVGANLYNKGVDIKLLNVYVWGILGMITRDETKKTFKQYSNRLSSSITQVKLGNVFSVSESLKSLSS